MKQYRYTLGRTADTSINLVTNGTFTGGLTGWTTIGTTKWTGASNEARVGTGAGSQYDQLKLKQTGIVYPGNYYYLQYDLRKQSGTQAEMTPSIGGLYYNVIDNIDINTSTSYTTIIKENVFCGFGNDLLFYSKGDSAAAIDNVLLYNYAWNEAIIDDPLNWDKINITKKRDSALNGLIVEYILDLTFIGDGYDFIYNEYITNGFCSQLPVKIEKINPTSGIYEPFFEGIIYINDCEFNITKRTVKVTIEDKNGSIILTKNQNVKINLLAEFYTPNVILALNTEFPIRGPNPLREVDINDATGAYCVYTTTYSSLIYDFLRKVIIVSSNYRLDFDSTFFSSGTFEGFCIILGKLLKGFPNDSQLSLKQIFDELNKLFDLTFAIDTSGALPKVLIEPKIDYLNSTSVLSLNNVNDLKIIFDNENIVKTINIGYEYIDASPMETGLNKPEGEQFFTSNQCAESALNLVSRFIQSSDIIRGMKDGTITGNKYDNNFIWLETDGVINATCGQKYRTINSGSGTFDINVDIETIDNINRFIETLQTTFIKSLDSGSIIVNKTNATLAVIYSFTYPITKAQYDLINQAYDTIDFNTDGTGLTTKTGYILEAEFQVKTGLTKFKLLSS